MDAHAALKPTEMHDASGDETMTLLSNVKDFFDGLSRGLGLFLFLYLAFYRWAYDRKTRAERLEDALQRIRRIEERSQS